MDEDVRPADHSHARFLHNKNRVARLFENPAQAAANFNGSGRVTKLSRESGHPLGVGAPSEANAKPWREIPFHPGRKSGDPEPHWLPLDPNAILKHRLAVGLDGDIETRRKRLALFGRIG